jgi:ABC-type transporter lipoprotein component MlaA
MTTVMLNDAPQRNLASATDLGRFLLTLDGRYWRDTLDPASSAGLDRTTKDFAKLWAIGVRRSLLVELPVFGP